MNKLALLAMAPVAAVLSLSSPAKAQEIAGALDAVLSILGVTSASQREVIDYQERPPLVVPPRSTLPAPQDRDAARSRVNWPNDPDIARRTPRAADIEAAEDRRRMNSNQPRLTNTELARGRNPSGLPAIVPGPEPGNDLHDAMTQMRQADAQYFRRQSQEAELPLGAAPPRRYLVDPPSALRTPTQRLARTAEPPDTRSDRDGGAREFTTEQARRR